jgi:phosphomannomutase|tara:strand:- start:5043 stop:5765 length:723 start_codon:yes stop_codon:yes gene_type:complete
MEGLVYLFDVDGTLTPPMKAMRPEAVMRFLDWMKEKPVYIVAGSSRDEVYKQLPASILSRVKGVFCSSANELWRQDELVYKNNWRPTSDFLSYLSNLYKSSHFTPKGKNFIEKRTGMVNFSIIGREAHHELRDIYCEWDKKNMEREKMAQTIMKDFPELDACIGGQISIDIYPKGNDKSQASKWVAKNLKKEMAFFGDKCHKGGNDYPIIYDIILESRGTYHNVTSYNMTLDLLENKYLS